MVDVNYLLLARHAEPIGPEGAFNALGAGVAGLVTPALPVLLPMFFVIARISLEREDLGIEHTIGVRVIDPSGAQLASSENYPVARQEELSPDRELLLANMVLGLQNLVFTEEGLHKFELLFDGEKIKDARLRVEVRGSAEATQAPSGGAGE